MVKSHFGIRAQPDLFYSNLLQAKEHWKLECQLLQMKHDKLREQSPLVECTSNSFTEETRTEEIKQVFVFPYLLLCISTSEWVLPTTFAVVYMLSL